MTATSPITTFDTPTSPSTRKRWTIALAAGTLAIAGIAGGLTIADGSGSDAPVTPAFERVDEGATSSAGRLSADAAERWADNAGALQCSGLSADAAERCGTSGR